MQCATNRAGFYYEKSSLAAAVLGLVRRQLKSLVVGYTILQIKECTTAIVQACRLGLKFCVTKVILKMSLYPFNSGVNHVGAGPQDQEAGPVLHETPLHSGQSPA